MSRGDWLKCEDCDSQVDEVWHGPVFAVEVTHSPTCPYWRDRTGPEVAVAFVPSNPEPAP